MIVDNWVEHTDTWLRYQEQIGHEVYLLCFKPVPNAEVAELTMWIEIIRGGKWSPNISSRDYVHLEEHKVPYNELVLVALMEEMRNRYGAGHA